MSNEQNQKHPTPQAMAAADAPRTGPQRIKLSWLYARDGAFDMPGGQNQISNLRLGHDGKDGAEKRRHYTADFIPAWNCVEVTWLSDGIIGPREVVLVPMHAFKRIVVA